MYQFYGKVNWEHVVCPLYRSWSLLRGSIIGSSTVYDNRTPLGCVESLLHSGLHTLNHMDTRGGCTSRMSAHDACVNF